MAELEEETSQPSPRALRKAVRTVIAHCIYGADINPMAIELAKVALWLESQDAGKPLAFLDHRLRVGNSLLGTTPELMNAEDTLPEKTVRGVTSRAVHARTLHLPDDAFSVIEGDDKKTVSELKKRNKAERESLIRNAYGEQALFDASGDLAPLSAMVRALDKIEPDSAENVQAQESTYQAIRQNARLRASQRLADAWCAAFVAPKVPGVTSITTSTLHALKRTPDAPALQGVWRTVEGVADQYRFLHPHIEFPDVFAGEGQGGFDCVLGNPPWESLEVSLEDSVSQKNIIRGAQNYIKNSGRYKMTLSGKNLYLYFTELSLKYINSLGKTGLIVPTEIVQAKPSEMFSKYIVGEKILESLYDFENKKIWFSSIDSRYRFSLITMSFEKVHNSRFVFDINDISEIKLVHRIINIGFDIILAASPSRFSVPAFKSSGDAKLFLTSASRVRMMANDDSEISGTLMFNFSNEEAELKVQSQGRPIENYYNTYDGENIHQFEHQRKGKNLEGEQFCTEFLMPSGYTENRLTALFSETPKWITTLRRQARGNDSFVGIAAIIPAAAVEGSLSVIVIENNSPVLASIVVSNFNTYAFNYFISLRISGPNVNKGVYEQIPIIYNSAKQIHRSTEIFITPHVLELTYLSRGQFGVG